MRNLIAFIVLLLCLPVSGQVKGNIDYRALLTNYFTTNFPSPGYVGLNTNAGSGLSNFIYQVSTNVQQMGSATNISIIAGTNVVVVTNSSSTWTISSTGGGGTQLWATNAADGTITNINFLLGIGVSGNEVVSNQGPTTTLQIINTNSGQLVLKAAGDATSAAKVIVYSDSLGEHFTVSNNGNLGRIRSLQYNWPTTNGGAGQLLTQDGGTPMQIYFTDPPIGGITGGATNFATTNTSTGLTNAIQDIITNQTTSAAFTNEIKSISTNVALNTFSNQIPNFINGTTNYIGKFSPNTNTMGNSIVLESATNEWDWLSRPAGTAWTNSITNAIGGQVTSANNFSRLEIVSSAGMTVPPAGSSEFNLIQGKQGTSSTSLIYPLQVFGAWQFNSAVNTPGGFTAGYLLPMADNTYNIGTSSAQVHDLAVGDQIFCNSTHTAPYIGRIGGFGIDFTTTTIDFWETAFGIYASFLNLSQGGRQLCMGQNVLSFSAANPGTASTGRGYITYGNVDQYVQIGTNCAVSTSTPVRLMSSRGTGTDSASANLEITAGGPTGSGSAGHYIVLSPTNSATTGTTERGKQTRVFISSHAVTLTESSATKIFSVVLNPTNHIGMRIFSTIDADDTTDYQCLNETIAIAAVNKNTTITTSVSAAAPSATVATTGTLTSTWTAVQNSAAVDVKVSAVSSLTQTTLNCRWMVELSGDGPMTVTAQ